MSDSKKTTPGPDKTTDDKDPGLHETDTANAEQGLDEPRESFDPASGTAPGVQQDALDVMAALCRELGLIDQIPDGPKDSARNPQGAPDTAPQSAFDIIQRFLFDRGPSESPPQAVNHPVSDPVSGNEGTSESAPGFAPAPNFNDAIPDASHLLATAFYGGGPDSPHAQDSSEASAMNTSTSSPHGAWSDDSAAQWRLITTHPDGSETDLAGPVIKDDMFRTAMPCLQGNTGPDADSPDWSIHLTHGLPLAQNRTSAQSAIGAKLTALEIPTLVRDWHLGIGPGAGAQSELSVTLPPTAPSHLRALMFDSTIRDDASPAPSETMTYGGGDYALHIEQEIGAVPGNETPNQALIRLVFADRPAIPVQLEYTGALPSPVLGGLIAISPSHAIPFRVQITPPSEGDKGAGLVILVRYDQETSFNVTARLLTSAKSCTPTAILSCSAQSDNSACSAASMIANANGRLETRLTGLADTPDDAALEKYGFVLAPQDSKDSTAAKADATDNSPPSSDAPTTTGSTGRAAAAKAPSRPSSTRKSGGKGSSNTPSDGTDNAGKPDNTKATNKGDS